MNKKLLLTSVVLLGFCVPAMAVTNRDALTSNSTLVQENSLYGSPSAISIVLDGADGSDGNANVRAEPWYTVLPGYYWKANTPDVSLCTSGNYCPGSGGVLAQMTDTDQFLQSCSTQTNGTYPYSASAASDKMLCYKSCPAINHAASTNGNVYFSDNGGINACYPGSCDSGYERTGVYPWAQMVEPEVARMYVYKDYNGSIAGDGASYASNLFPDINSNSAYVWGVHYDDGFADTVNASVYGKMGRSLVDYPYGTVIANGSIEMLADSASAEGATCYCRVTGVQNFLGTQTGVVAVNGPWVSIGSCSSASACTTIVADYGESSDPVPGDIIRYIPSSLVCSAASYLLTFNGNNGTIPSGGTNNIYAVFDSPMPAIVTDKLPERTGYSFEGYYNQATGGTQYYTKLGASARTWNIAEDSDLFAHWSANTYTVTLNPTDGAFGTSGGGSVTATYDSPMPALTILPTRKGHSLKGFWDRASVIGGTRYYNNIGQSTHDWDKAEDFTLYARWDVNQYNIFFNANGGEFSTGFVPMVTEYFGSYMQDLDSSLIPSRHNYQFAGYYDTDAATGGKQYYNSLGKATNVLDEEGLALYARWIFEPPVVHVTLDNNGADTAGTVEFWYKYTDNNPCYYYSSSTNMDASHCLTSISIPTKKGYTFNGYVFVRTGTGLDTLVEKINENGVISSDLYAEFENDITLQARWEPKKITIAWQGVDVDGQKSETTTKVSYGGSIPTPEKGYSPDGQRFVGWMFVNPNK